MTKEEILNVLADLWLDADDEIKGKIYETRNRRRKEALDIATDLIELHLDEEANYLHGDE